MDKPLKQNHDESAAAGEAIEWLERLKIPREGDNAAFLKWLTESRAHVRELLLASAWDVALRGADSAREMDVQKLLATALTNVIPVHERDVNAGDLPQRHPRGRWVNMRVASAAGALVLLMSWLLWGLFLPEKYATSIGEQRSFELADGSVVSLSAQTTMNVELSKSARELYLKSGQAIFAVAHDAARPFRVHVGSVVVQAIGTKFDVRRIGDRVQVAVLEGKVRITPEQASGKPLVSTTKESHNTEVAAGHAINISPQGITAPAAVDMEDVTAWQQRRLKFRYSTLEEVVHEFNRFNRTLQIRIEGDGLRTRPISGVFEADDPESLLASLTSGGDVAVERDEGEVVIRGVRGD